MRMLEEKLKLLEKERARLKEMMRDWKPTLIKPTREFPFLTEGKLRIQLWLFPYDFFIYYYNEIRFQ